MVCLQEPEIRTLRIPQVRIEAFCIPDGQTACLSRLKASWCLCHCTVIGLAHRQRGLQVTSTEVVLAARCRRKYANAHTYHVNSIALSSDQETFITADDLRVNLWHLDVSDQVFNVVDMKPANMEELTEVCSTSPCNVNETVLQAP